MYLDNRNGMRQFEYDSEAESDEDDVEPAEAETTKSSRMGAVDLYRRALLKVHASEVRYERPFSTYPMC